MAASISRVDRKRAEIIATAQKLFIKNGYSVTSMSQISVALRGSKTTLYNHFSSKEELLRAVVQNVVAPKPDDCDQSTAPTEFRAWLNWFGTSTIIKITSHNYLSLQRLAAAEALRFPEIGQAFYNAIKPRHQMASERFAKAMTMGLLRRADPCRAAEDFLELCTGWMLRRAIWNIQKPPTGAEIANNVDNAVSVFLDGYLSRAGGAEGIAR